MDFLTTPIPNIRYGSEYRKHVIEISPIGMVLLIGAGVLCLFLFSIIPLPIYKSQSLNPAKGKIQGTSA
jgi:hypothetical protein